MGGCSKQIYKKKYPSLAYKYKRWVSPTIADETIMIIIRRPISWIAAGKLWYTFDRHRYQINELLILFYYHYLLIILGWNINWKPIGVHHLTPKVFSTLIMLRGYYMFMQCFAFTLKDRQLLYHRYQRASFAILSSGTYYSRLLYYYMYPPRYSRA